MAHRRKLRAKKLELIPRWTPQKRPVVDGLGFCYRSLQIKL